MLRIVRRADCGAEQWDRVVSTSPDGWAWALWDWQELILSVPRWQLSEAGFGVLEDDRLVAVVPLHWNGDRTRLSGSGFGLTSPALIADATPEERTRYLTHVFDHVRALARDGGAHRIEFALSPVSQSSLDRPDGPNPFVEFGFDDESGQARILDLRRDADAILAQCSRDTRQQLKRARAAGLEVRRADWSMSLDAYYALHSETYHRTGVQPHPREYFLGIATHMAPKGHSMLWGVYDAAGNAIAFHNSSRLGASAQYHTGCSTESALSNGANYLAFWGAILGAKDAGCDWYEIGEVFVDETTGKKRGLTTFKSKFGGELRPLFRSGMALQVSAPAAVDEPAELDAWSASPAPERGGAVLRQLLRRTRRLSERVIGPAITNTAARAVVSGIRAIIDAPPETPAPVAIAPAPIRFFRPFWDNDEERAVTGLDSSISPQQREADLAQAIRRIEGFADEAGVLFAASGRGALLAALRVFASRQPGRDVVIVPSYSCKGLFDAIVGAGLRPRFVDVDSNLVADPAAVRAAFGDDVLAVVLVHLAGQRFTETAIVDEARARGIYVIEDKAHAFGSGWRLNSDAVLYSFGLGKNLSATAGGAIVVNGHGDDLAALRQTFVNEPDQVARDRYLHCRAAYFSDTLGLGGYPANLRPPYGLASMNRVDAALLASQLAKADAIVSRRRRHASTIAEALARFPQLFRLQSADGHAYTKLVVVLPSGAIRDRFLTFMSAHGVELEWMYIPLHTRDFGRPFVSGPLPQTDRLDGTVVNVPVRPNLTGDEVRRIAGLIHDYAATEATHG